MNGCGHRTPIIHVIMGFLWVWLCLYTVVLKRPQRGVSLGPCTMSSALYLYQARTKSLYGCTVMGVVKGWCTQNVVRSVTSYVTSMHALFKVRWYNSGAQRLHAVSLSNNELTGIKTWTLSTSDTRPLPLARVFVTWSLSHSAMLQSYNATEHIVEKVVLIRRTYVGYYRPI